jgi:hypothetical protein
MLKRLVLCVFLLCAAFRVGATDTTDYTDIWFIPAESGWGVNVIQSDTFLFVTFFIYGSDNKPTWYTAQLTQDASGNYNGQLYATTGTYYAMPWKPSDNVVTAVGTASFQPTSPYTAKLVYTLTTGSVTVTKAVQRQALTPITIGGSYVGAQAGAYSGGSCASAGPYSDTFTLQINQSTSGAVTFAFAYDGLAETCTFAGTLTQFGKRYLISSATYKCPDGLNTNASFDEITATTFGIEGRFSAVNVGGGCREDATFSGVLH